MGQALPGIGDVTGPTLTPLTGASPRPLDSASAARPAPRTGDSLRYSVERGEDKLVLVFKVVDATTNRIVSQTPWDAPQSVPQDPNYRSGALLDQSF